MLEAMTTITSTPIGPVLELDGLTKSYGGATVVDNISLTVERGEIFGLLGTNGAGKTTSVECAQGIRRPDHGHIRVLGHDPITERGALAGRVGSQLQDSSLPDRLRVGEAIALFADSSAQMDRAMDEWRLTELTKVPFAGLSGGQRQRLFLALALLNRPEVVFLDELTQGLDPDARRTVWTLIEQVREQGTTVVLVTHFMEEAEVLCDRLAVMTNGKVVATGTAEHLIERYGPGVRVRFAAQPDDLTWVGSVPGVAGVRSLGHEIEATGDASITAELGHGLVDRGRSPISLRVDQPCLEDALLELMQPDQERA